MNVSIDMISYIPVFKSANYIAGEFIIEFDNETVQVILLILFTITLIGQIEIATDAGNVLLLIMQFLLPKIQFHLLFS